SLNLPHTRFAKSWNYDPSIVLNHDLYGADGKCFAEKGTLFNPLTMMRVHRPLIFLNGDEKSHVEWAKKQIIKAKGFVKVVLVNGSIVETSERLQAPIYFDQAGKLTSKFHIEHVPAKVMQKSKQLYLKVSEEIA